MPRAARFFVAGVVALAPLVPLDVEAAYNFPTVVPQFTGDCTTTGAGGTVFTCSKFNGGTSFGTAAGATLGTSGASVPVLNAANTWSAAQSFASISATTGAFTGTLTGVGATFTGLATLTGGHVVGTLTVTTSGTTLVAANEEVCLNPTAAISITLDAAPVVGEQHVVTDCAFAAATNNETITPTSGKINNTTSLVLNQNGQSASLTYWGSTIGWIVK